MLNLNQHSSPQTWLLYRLIAETIRAVVDAVHIWRLAVVDCYHVHTVENYPLNCRVREQSVIMK